MRKGEIPSAFRAIIIRIRKRRVRKSRNNKGKNRIRSKKRARENCQKKGREEPNINK